MSSRTHVLAKSAFRFPMARFRMSLTPSAPLIALCLASCDQNSSFCHSAMFSKRPNNLAYHMDALSHLANNACRWGRTSSALVVRGGPDHGLKMDEWWPSADSAWLRIVHPLRQLPYRQSPLNDLARTGS